MYKKTKKKKPTTQVFVISQKNYFIENSNNDFLFYTSLKGDPNGRLLSMFAMMQLKRH